MLHGAYVRATVDGQILGGAYVPSLTALMAAGVPPDRGFDGINHPSSATLIADGIEVAFLYAGTPGSTLGKDFTAAQYRDYRSHGIKCAFVYEDLADDWRGGAAAGRANAAALLADLAAKRTDGTDPVTCSIDEHVDAADLATVVDYVTGFARAITSAGYRGPVGVYGFREVLDAVHAAGVLAWYWCAGPRSTVPAYANVWQDNTTHITVGGSSDDLDWILVPLPEALTDMTPDELFAADIPANPKAGTVGFLFRDYQRGTVANSAGGMALDIINTTNGAQALKGAVAGLTTAVAAKHQLSVQDVEDAVAAEMAKVVTVHVDVTNPAAAQPAPLMAMLAASAPITRWQALWATLKSGGWLSVVQTLLGFLVTVGVLTVVQDQALVDVATCVLNLVQVIQTAVHLFQGAKQVRAVDRMARVSQQMARQLAAARPEPMRVE